MNPEASNPDDSEANNIASDGQLAEHNHGSDPSEMSPSQESDPGLAPQLLALLRCPQTGNRILIATDQQVTRVNSAIAAGECRDMSGELVAEPIQTGLVSDCGTWLYPVRDSIPTMIAEESIKLSSDTASLT